MNLGVRRRFRHPRSRAAGAALGLAIDVGGFWLLVHGGVSPGTANVVSALCAIVVYLVVTRTVSRAPVRLRTIAALAIWSGLNILVVSVLIQQAVEFDDRPLRWKLALIPVSSLANIGFVVLLRRPRAWPLAGRIGGATIAAVLVGASMVGLGSRQQAQATTPVASPSVAGPVAKPVSPPTRIAEMFGSGRSVIGRSVVVGGLGSSVGAGATLQDPARDAPVAWFTRSLQRRVGGGALARWTTVNGSVNGSTIHDGVARDWPALARSHPDIVVLAYGMNDGAPAQFDTGETYNGSMRDLATLVEEIRASGAVPVLLTSPSPHTVRFNWAPPAGPTAKQWSSIDTTHPVRQVDVPGYGIAPESTRHAAVDAGIREVAASLGVDLIDVEPYWLRAVATYGQDPLFNRTEFVHPDLLGHALSYHAAIDAWTAGPALYAASIQSGP